MQKTAKPELKIDWATHEAAEYACTKWHYSKCLPTGKLVKIGAWEDGKFIGVVIFSRGASPHLLSKYGLKQVEGCELTRIALTKHSTHVSRILSIAIKFLKQKAPGLRLAVSFADPEQGHHGGVYQATNWIYTGTSGSTIEYYVRGKWTHVRGAYATVKTNKKHAFKTRERRGKHRYLFPLDETLRAKFIQLQKPYPKRPVEAEESMRSSTTRKIGGASPTSPVHSRAVLQQKSSTR
jgi:hypothetical protein